MGNQDWNQLGNDIKNMVQDAINSQDFSKLNQGINRAINGAVDGLGSLWNGGQSGGHWEIRDDGQPRPGQPFSGGWQTKSGMRKNQSWAQQGPRFNDQRVNQLANQTKKFPPGPYKNPSGAAAAGYVMAIFGGISAVGSGIALFICLVVALMTPNIPVDASVGLNIANSILFASTLSCGAVCLGGFKKIGFVQRFRRYVNCIQGRGYCQLEELSKSIGKPESFIRKDVKKMLNKGMFLEGHLDSQETCLITTNQAYSQYKTAQRQLEERQERVAAPTPAKESAPKTDNVPAEVKELLDEGNAYLDHIRKCNDRISGQEISGKISKMELIVQNIFKRLQTHPDVAPDLKKMMEYYLPTTVKLLEAYAELDAQSVQGENITNSKREIEETLDTLNQAFEKLLDSIFKDTAWDLSTDISVLQTLLAQEGLIGDDFKMKDNKTEE